MSLSLAIAVLAPGGGPGKAGTLQNAGRDGFAQQAGNIDWS